MQSTREKIITTLLTNPGSTINSLAEAVDINGISVRHHLTILQSENLVYAEEQRHGVGRPRLIYFLTELGRERFPSSYLKLSKMLLQQIKAILPGDQYNLLFEKIAENISNNYEDKLDSLPIERQLDQIVAILSEEGFLLEWKYNDGHYEIKTINCPYYHVGIDHPEICKIDQIIISTLLKKPLTVKECLLDGDSCCSFIVDLKTKDSNNG